MAFNKLSFSSVDLIKSKLRNNEREEEEMPARCKVINVAHPFDSNSGNEPTKMG